MDVIKFDLVSKAPDETDCTVYNGAEIPVLPDEGKNVDETVYYLRGTMDTAAGNEYADLTLEGVTITVYATQYTHEYASEDDQYDLGALYADGTGGTTNPEPDPNPGEGEGEGTTVNRDALNNAIASAKTYIDAGNNNKYTAESWDTLTGAYEKAINVVADADQDTVDAAAIPDGEKDYKATAAAVEAKTGYTRTILSDSFDDAVGTGVNASDDWMRTITTQNGANKYIPGE